MAAIAGQLQEKEIVNFKNEFCFKFVPSGANVIKPSQALWQNRLECLSLAIFFQDSLVFVNKTGAYKRAAQVSYSQIKD